MSDQMIGALWGALLIGAGIVLGVWLNGRTSGPVTPPTPEKTETVTTGTPGPTLRLDEQDGAPEGLVMVPVHTDKGVVQLPPHVVALCIQEARGRFDLLDVMMLRSAEMLQAGATALEVQAAITHGEREDA